MVDGEEEVGNSWGADRWSCQQISETNILKVTQELARSVGESQRETPEEPLEGDDSCGHDREPDQGQCRLSPSKTRVEETAGAWLAFVTQFSTFSYMHIPDTWNHEKHKRSRSDHPRDITGLRGIVSAVQRELGWQKSLTS